MYVHGLTVEFDFHHVQATNNNKGGVILQPRPFIYFFLVQLQGKCRFLFKNLKKTQLTGGHSFNIKTKSVSMRTFSPSQQPTPNLEFVERINFDVCVNLARVQQRLVHKPTVFISATHSTPQTKKM